ncbi:unnamed protein product [Meloidogyne enterolobii]|uniref:Uncharacterized protein n=1 Tax=Meloidogyne enterolobii TaxID=390850 RepID=A0ACB1AK74_MELEN
MSPYHLFEFEVWIFYFSKSGQRPRQFFRSQFFSCLLQFFKFKICTYGYTFLQLLLSF